jgi:hypothetical protein
MKTKTHYSLFLLIISISLIALFASLASAQSGQMGFSSIITDKSSNGTVTNASALVIEDSHQSWATNTWTGYFIQTTNPNGSGQVCKIISNTAKTITVSPAFTHIPEINSNFVIRHGYKESTQGLKLKLYMQFNNTNKKGGNFTGYSCRILASDTSAVEFVSVEQGSGLGNAWTPSYYAPPGQARINWLVLQMYDDESLAPGLYHIATVTVNLLQTDVDKAITFYVTNCPDGGLPIGLTKESDSFLFDTTSNDAFSGREEILVLHNTNEIDQLFAGNTSESPTTIGSYPNPFNPTTTIQYELSEYSEVRLVVFDILGRIVSELVNTHQCEGIHSIAWEPHNASSGTYFARLLTVSSVSNQKEVKTIRLAYAK